METYRVIVQRLGDDDSENVVELLASREQLARFAPGVVAEALGATSVPAGGAMEGVPAEIGPNADGHDGPAQMKTTRKRRTKAEIEADTAREKAAVAPVRVPEQVIEPGPAPEQSPAAIPYNPFLPK